MGLVSSLVEYRQNTAKQNGVPVPYVLQLPSTTVRPMSKIDDYLKAYGQIGWVFAVVSRISSSVGETDWKLYRGKGKERQEVDSHPLLDLIYGANPYMTGQELGEYTQMHLDLAGEAFWILNKTRKGLPGEIWPVPPNRIKIVPDRNDFIRGYIYQWGTEEIPFEPDEVVHFRYPNPYDFYRGLGPLQAMAIDLDSEYYAAKYNRNFFVNSARPDAVLETDGSLSDAQFERQKEEWRVGHQGVDRAHRVALLEAGLKYKQVAVNQKDMDFLNQRKYSRDMILGVYGMPKPIIGIVEDVNRANSETAEYTYARWVVTPRQKRIVRKLNETLVPMFGDDLVLGFVDVTPENRERARLDAESGVKAGYMMLDEARAQMGFDPLPDGQGQALVHPMTSELVPIGEGRKMYYIIDRPKALRSKELSDEQKDKLGELFIKRMEKREAKFKSLVLAHFAEQETELVAKLEATKSHKDAAEDIFDEEEWGKRLSDESKPLLQATLVEAAEEAINDYELGIDFNLRNPRVTRWIGERLKLYSTSVTDTTKQAIAEQLREAEANGEGISQMVQRIKGYYGENGEYRAEVTARTEVLGASNRGAYESYVQAGVPGKTWWSSLDERVREAHRVAHGQRRKINEPFTVMGEKIMHPGEGSPANSIQCRCTVLPVLEGE